MEILLKLVTNPDITNAYVVAESLMGFGSLLEPAEFEELRTKVFRMIPAVDRIKFEHGESLYPGA